MKICIVCGAYFKPPYPNQRRCPSCMAKNVQRRKRRNTSKVIAGNERAAREAGMSYGKFMAMRWVEEQRRMVAR